MKEFKKVLGKRSPSFKASGKVSKESKEEMVLLDDNDFASMNIRLPQPLPQRDSTGMKIKGNFEIAGSYIRTNIKKEPVYDITQKRR